MQIVDLKNFWYQSKKHQVFEGIGKFENDSLKKQEIRLPFHDDFSLSSIIIGATLHLRLSDVGMEIKVVLHRNNSINDDHDSISGNNNIKRKRKKT